MKITFQKKKKTQLFFCLLHSVLEANPQGSGMVGNQSPSNYWLTQILTAREGNRACISVTSE